MYKEKKTDYQKGYEDGEDLIVTHVNIDGRPKAKEYIQKLADKNKGKTDALNDFINNSATYFVPPKILQENNHLEKCGMKHNKIRLTETTLKRIIKETVCRILEYNEEWLKRVEDCDFLSDKDKRAIQLASINNWDRHEREEKIKNDIRNLERMSNKNVYDKRNNFLI